MRDLLVSNVDLLSALSDTEWPGRNQTLKHGDVTYFLDGAHTMRSMQACVDWFVEAAAQHERNARWAPRFSFKGQRGDACVIG